MSACNPCSDREKAVRLAAELLRLAGVAFFPLDIRLLLRPFSRQVSLSPYSNYKGKAALIEGKPVDPFLYSQDGFCVLVRDMLMDFGAGPVDGSRWLILYNDDSRETRIRFTLMHELGHILLGHSHLLHTSALDSRRSDPAYLAAEALADQFSACALAPAPAVFRLLTEHGFTCSAETGGVWKLTNPQAPFLRNLGQLPDAESLLTTAFGLSLAAARRRLAELPRELEIWQNLDPALKKYMEEIPHRSGWFCTVCHTRRRTASPYCPGCGKGWSYAFQDPGQLSRPVIGLRENGRFAFCSVCGNAALPEDAVFCPVCGAPVVNECENASFTDGDFVRAGMPVVRGTHRCRPTDIFCGVCGVLTSFGARYGPRKNQWLPDNPGERCRTRGAVYPPVLSAENESAEGRLSKCPSCGGAKSIRGGRYCARCFLPLENGCVPSGEGSGAHPCAPDDRFCRRCGRPTLFFRAGFLPAYAETETFAALRQAEEDALRPRPPRLWIAPEGTISVLNQEER